MCGEWMQLASSLRASLGTGRAKVIVGMFTVQKARFVYPNGRAEEVQEDMGSHPV